MARYRGTTEAILRVLADFGPMTRAEICRELGPRAINVSSLVSNLIRNLPATPRRAYICGWVYDMEGQRPYPRAVYALGDRPNAKRPSPKKRTEVVNAYRARLKAKYQQNSIFNLARRVSCSAPNVASKSTASQSHAEQNSTSGDGASVSLATING